MQAVLDLGVPASRIVYANPCKQPSHVRFAASAGVRLTVADCASELHKVAQHHPRSDLLLRLAVDDSQAQWQCVISCKYGAPFGEMSLLLASATELGLTVRGVSFHIGSGCYAAGAFADAVERAEQVFELAEGHGVAMDVLDIGGGFPGSSTCRVGYAALPVARPGPGSAHALLDCMAHDWHTLGLHACPARAGACLQLSHPQDLCRYGTL